MSESKIIAGLGRLAANYLRDPVGARQPAVNGTEIVETRDSVRVSVTSNFTDATDLAIAHEIVQNGLIEMGTIMSITLRKLDVFSREQMLGVSQETITAISVTTFKDRLKAEVLASKVRSSAEIRTAIAHTARVYTAHAVAGSRGA